MTSYKKVFAKGFLWTFIESFGSKLINLAVFVLFARFLLPEDFGVFAIAKVFVDFTGVFVQHSFGSVLIQKEDLNKPDKDTAFWTTIGIGSLLFILFFFTSPLVASLYGKDELTIILQLLSISLLILSLDAVPTALLKRDFKFKALALRVLISELIAGLIASYFLFQGYGLYTLVIYHLTSVSIKVLLLLALSVYTPSLNFSLKSLSQLYAFGLNIIGVRISEYVSKRGDDAIVGFFLGSHLLGVYVIAYKIMRVSENLLARVITKLLFPIFSRMQDDDERFANAFGKVLQTVLIIIVPTFTIIAFNAEFLIIRFFGEEWSEAVIIMQLLMIAGIFQILSGLYRQAIISKGRPRDAFRISLVSMILVLFTVTLAAQYNLIFVVLSLIVTNMIILLVYMFNLKTSFKIAGFKKQNVLFITISLFVLPSTYILCSIYMDSKSIFGFFLSNSLVLLFLFIIGYIIFRKHRLIFPLI